MKGAVLCGEGGYENLLYFLLGFTVNLKLLLKSLFKSRTKDSYLSCSPILYFNT